MSRSKYGIFISENEFCESPKAKYGYRKTLPKINKIFNSEVICGKIYGYLKKGVGTGPDDYYKIFSDKILRSYPELIRRKICGYFQKSIESLPPTYYYPYLLQQYLDRIDRKDQKLEIIHWIYVGDIFIGYFGVESGTETEVMDDNINQMMEYLGQKPQKPTILPEKTRWWCPEDFYFSRFGQSPR